MKRIQLYISSVLAGVLCFGGFALGTQAQEQEGAFGVYQVEKKTEASGEFVSYEYPVLTGIDSFDQEILDKVNQYFYDEAVRTVQTEAANMEQVQAELQEYNSEASNALAFDVTCDSLYLDSDIFSVMQYVYTYNGGTHGYGYAVGTSFDLRTGEQLTMGDLLGCEEETAKEAVVEAYREHIIGQVENITEDSIRSYLDEMAYWKTAEGMYADIPAYGVASYAAGPQQALVTPEIVAKVKERMGTQNSGADEGAAGSAADTDAETSGQITVINGILAPASDFIFPHSSKELLTDEDLTKLQADTVEERHYWSQLAINEILARYGYTFSEAQGGAAKEAYDQFEGKDWYEQAKPYCPSASANEMLYTYISATELENVNIICEWQKQNGCYY